MHIGPLIFYQKSLLNYVHLKIASHTYTVRFESVTIMSNRYKLEYRKKITLPITNCNRVIIN